MHIVFKHYLVREKDKKLKLKTINFLHSRTKKVVLMSQSKVMCTLSYSKTQMCFYIYI